MTGAARLLRREQGAASVLALGIVGATVALAVAAVVVSGASIGSQRAASAADAAALAAADVVAGVHPGVACEVASRVALRNGSELVACEIDGPTATIAVRVVTSLGDATASARAGPPGWR